MPFKSEKQRKFFGAMRSHPEEARAKGIKPQVIDEFLKAPRSPSSPSNPDPKFQMLRNKLRNGR